MCNGNALSVVANLRLKSIPPLTQPLGPHPERLGDTPRVEPAIPKDPSDPYLREWIKTEPGPVKFDGVPCSFPGRVWKSKVGNYFNMVCAYGGRAPWARYTSTDPKLMEWKVADTSFTQGVDKGADAGALFHKIPNADPDGPTHMINTNTGSAFYLGKYNSSTEVFTVTDSEVQVIDSASRYHWAASGNDGPDPDTDSGRLLTVSWVSNSPSVISLIRELSYDRASKQLVSNPVPEYTLLRNGTFLEGKPLGPLAPGSSKALPYPGASGGASDTTISFDPSGWHTAVSGFGVAARVGSSASLVDDRSVDAAFVVNFSASAPDVDGTRLVTVNFVEPSTTPPSPGPPSTILPYMNATDLGGGDYKLTHMPPNTDPHVCQAGCLKDPACMVWTYVIRGSPPGSGDCIFKSATHSCPSHNSKCTSGNGHGPSKCTRPPPPRKAGGTKNFPLLKGETLDVRMLVDRPLTEVFVNGGRAAYTFADDTFSVERTGVSVFNTGSDVIGVSNASAYSMGCGWYAD